MQALRRRRSEHAYRLRDAEALDYGGLASVDTRSQWFPRSGAGASTVVVTINTYEDSCRGISSTDNLVAVSQ